MEKKLTALQELIEKLEYDYKCTLDQATQAGILCSITTAKSLLPKEREQRKFFFDCGRQFQLTGEGTFNQVEEETFTQTYQQ